MTMVERYTKKEDTKMIKLYPLFLVPAYAAIIQIIVSVMEALENDLFGFFLMFFTVPARSNNSSRGMHGNCMGVGVAL